jgi:hypothetical protein
VNTGIVWSTNVGILHQQFESALLAATSVGSSVSSLHRSSLRI